MSEVVQPVMPIDLDTAEMRVGDVTVTLRDVKVRPLGKWRPFYFLRLGPFALALPWRRPLMKLSWERIAPCVWKHVDRETPP